MKGSDLEELGNRPVLWFPLTMGCKCLASLNDLILRYGSHSKANMT